MYELVWLPLLIGSKVGVRNLVGSEYDHVDCQFLVNTEPQPTVILHDWTGIYFVSDLA